MKIKKWFILILGILSFLCPIWIEKSPASSLSNLNGKQVSQKVEITGSAIAQLSPVQSSGELNAIDLEEQAQKLYETGQFSQAIALLQQLENRYATGGDRLGEARVFRNLALVYRQTGELSKAGEAITNSLNRLQNQSNTTETKRLLAQALEVRGLLQLSSGQPEQALDTWKQAAVTYQEIADKWGTIKTQINQAQALRRMGLYRQALNNLNALNNTLQQESDNRIKVKGLESLAVTLRVVGELDRSQKTFEQSLAIAQKMSDPELMGSIFFGIANTNLLQKKSESALNYYQKAAQISNSPYLKIRARVNQIRLLIDEKKWPEATELITEIQSNLNLLPLSQTAINARINLANSLLKMGREGNVYPLSKAEIAKMLATAVQQAETLQDRRSLAYALGNLGRLYEGNQQWKSARDLTEKATILAQSIKAADIAYRWEWQMGRILKQQGDRQGAIAAYTEAVNTIASIRSDLVATSLEAQFSFQESIEPVYRELVELLLPAGEQVEQSTLKQARDLIDSLQIAELDNFFKDACLKIQPVAIDEVDPKAAVFSTIILSDRLEVIAALPGQPLRRYTTVLERKEIEATIKQARNGLTVPRLQLSINNFLNPSQKIYNWLVRPLETELKNRGIETLVFVLDGSLRNIPMSALYDGKNYLVEKYSVAVAPSLKLVDAKPLELTKLEVLTAGLSEARQGFSPLPGVKIELEKIAEEVPSKTLLDRTFTYLEFKNKLKLSSFPIIHLATHGQFSSQIDQTFILTWDDRINAKDLDTLLRTDARENQSIELLVLSACQTASGDNRAVLGLTGMAIRAGARSTLASLWSVNDEATASLMIRFYEKLANLRAKSGESLTKAEALRYAQQLMLQDKEFSHPYFWAAFILVGNWL
ncbi:MAG TPA: CHAT domain-containing protein [Leptolyngbyaceae cyanobacterium]